MCQGLSALDLHHLVFVFCKRGLTGKFAVIQFVAPIEHDHSIVCDITPRTCTCELCTAGLLQAANHMQTAGLSVRGCALMTPALARTAVSIAADDLAY